MGMLGQEMERIAGAIRNSSHARTQELAAIREKVKSLGSAARKSVADVHSVMRGISVAQASSLRQDAARRRGGVASFLRTARMEAQARSREQRRKAQDAVRRSKEATREIRKETGRSRKDFRCSFGTMSNALKDRLVRFVVTTRSTVSALMRQFDKDMAGFRADFRGGAQAFHDGLSTRVGATVGHRPSPSSRGSTSPTPAMGAQTDPVRPFSSGGATLEKIGFPEELVRSLSDVGVHTIDDLAGKTEAQLLNISGVHAFMHDIKKALKRRGMHLRE